MDININDIKDIFGSMPLNRLPEAEVLAKNKSNQQLMFVGGLIVLGVGIYIGYRICKNQNVLVSSSSVKFNKDPKIKYPHCNLCNL